jgi:Beta-lactamase
LYALDEAIDRSLVADLDGLAAVLARQKPAWEPGTRQAYHGITIGFYQGELLRRIDPQHRSLADIIRIGTEGAQTATLIAGIVGQTVSGSTVHTTLARVSSSTASSPRTWPRFSNSQKAHI